MSTETHFDVIVLGGGPAGLTAGIYLSRARLSALILNLGTVGGQMVLTHEVANFPGYTSIPGYQLAQAMKSQAMEFGCVIKTISGISGLKTEGDIKEVELTDGRVFTAHAIILATGGRPRTLNIPGEEEYKGRGVSYCATCDGDFFTGKEIVVVGGGNSALEEAVSLTKYATKVTIVHEFDHFQASEYAIREAKANSSIHYFMESTLAGIYGNEKVEKVLIRTLSSGEEINYSADGVFIFIGYVPNTPFLDGVVALNFKGEIVVDSAMQTSVPGIFAAGDSIAKKIRQITTAVSDGTIAALSAATYVQELKSKIIKETANQIL